MTDDVIISSFTDIMKEAEKDRSLLRMLKLLAVKGKQFELASELRRLETEMFPASDQEKVAKEVAQCLSMVGLTCNDETAWKTYMAVKEYIKKEGEFTIRDASLIKAEAKKLEE